MNEFRKILAFVTLKRSLIVAICVLMVLNALLTALAPYITQQIIDAGFLAANLTDILLYSIAELLICTGIALCSYHCSKTSIRITCAVKADLMRTVINKLQHVKIPYFTKKQPAEIYSTAENDINAISEVFGESTFKSLASLIAGVAGISALFAMNWRLAVITSAYIPLKAAITILLSKHNERTVSKQIEAERQFSGSLNEFIDGIATLRTMGVSGRFANNVIKKQDAVLVLQQKSGILAQINMNAEAVSIQLVIDAIYICAGMLMVSGGQSTLGQVVAFTSYSFIATGYISEAFNIFYSLSEFMPSLRRYLVLTELDSVHCGSVHVKDINSIECIDLTYSYDGHIKILKDLNICIAAGEKVAIVGQNGTGKTTFLKLLAHLLSPSSGMVVMDDIDISEFDEASYSTSVAYVSQKPYLFNDTIRNNITCGKDISDEAIIALSLKLGLDDIINESSLNTIVGANGSELSGGQCQKLALIRALVGRPAVLLLDEAFSNLDQASRANCLEYILKAQEKLTVICVTHDKAVSGLFDSKFNLDQGKLVRVCA